jgi:hypothetical protein
MPLRKCWELSMMATETKTTTERMDATGDLMDWQRLYQKRFGDILTVGPCGLSSKKAIEVIKEALKTGKPYKDPRGKDVLL